MFCPKCKAEYREGFTECSDCQTALVFELPKDSSARPDSQLVVVFETEDPGQLAIAKSILEEAGIPFLDTAEGLQEFFGVGRMGGFKPLTGPAGLKVAEEDEVTARKLIQALVMP
jgi:hypothetical protein